MSPNATAPSTSTAPAPAVDPPTVEPDGAPAPNLRRRRTFGLLAAFAGYSWWASGQTATGPKAAAIAVPMVVAAAVAVWSWLHADRAERAGRPRPGASRRHLLTWGAVAAMLIVWEVRELLAGPRDLYPTVSSMVVAVSELRPLKALALVAWLGIGLLLIEPRRWRR